MSALRKFVSVPLMANFGYGVRPCTPLLHYPRPQFCFLRLSTSRPQHPVLKATPGCDLVYESADAEPTNQPATAPHRRILNEASISMPTSVTTEKNMSITFTCNVSIFDLYRTILRQDWKVDIKLGVISTSEWIYEKKMGGTVHVCRRSSS